MSGKKTFILSTSAALAAALVSGVTASEHGRVDPEQLFETSDKCLACHNGLVAPNGEDVSIGTRWRATVMAHSSKDPYWHAGVRRETIEHPKAKEAIEDTCSTCHMPMARFVRREKGEKGEVLAHVERGVIPMDSAIGALTEDGVSCAACHQIEAGNLGDEESFDGGFAVDTSRPPDERRVYGPFDVAKATTSIMRSATGFVPTEADHLRESAFCATCHTLYTHALDENGEAKAKIAEQAPYLEWLHSDYKDSQSCQDCHMAKVKGPSPISSVLGKSRDGAREHLFKGGNFFLVKLLSKHRNQLGVSATDKELAANLGSIRNNLTSGAASIGVDATGTSLDDGRLTFRVWVENLTGHKLPTAYPSRRVWLRVAVKDAAGRVLFESGAIEDNGSIKGNDNDADPLLFEPHYETIESEEEVQIFESIMGDLKGRVTTSLLSGASYLKDNRIIPMGFDKKTADEYVAVDRGALDDPDFEGGRDLVLYSAPVGDAKGPFRVEAALYYQSIGFRWAMNLSGIEAAEPRRFISMYKAFPGRETAMVLAETTAEVSPPPDDRDGSE